MRKTGKLYRLCFYNRDEEELFGIFGYPVEGAVATLDDCNVEEICAKNPDVWVVTLDTAVNADFEFVPDKCRRWILPDGRVDNAVCEVPDIFDMDDKPSNSYEEIWWREPKSWSDDV